MASSLESSLSRERHGLRGVVRLQIRSPVLLSLLVGAVLHALWLALLANSGGDLAAQDAWAGFAGEHPGSAYHFGWYGGLHLVSYSVISPYVMALLGVRTTMLIAGTVSCGLLALILARSPGVKRPLPPAMAGAFGLTCSAVSGRVTFGLGLCFALAAVAVVWCWPGLPRWRTQGGRAGQGVAAVVLSGLAAASSPVAGLFLGVVAAALFLRGRRAAASALGAAPCVVVGLSAWLFPFAGTQPMSFGTAVLPFLSAVGAVLLVPRQWRTVRLASAVYAVGVALTAAVSSQVGSNVTRLALLFAGVVFAASLPWSTPRSRRWFVLCTAFLAVTAWQVTNTVGDQVRTAPAASWNHEELVPLLDQLERLHAERGRVEAVPSASHRESSALAMQLNLARGWNRQADLERNPLFYDGTLTPNSYRSWLERWAVRYVVLPREGRLDHAGVAEAKIVESGQLYLKELWSDANWKLYEVRNPAPLAKAPAVIERATADGLTVTVPSAGAVLLRIPYSPWLAVVDEEGVGVSPATGHGAESRNGCLTRALKDRAGDEWTYLHAPAAGKYRIAAPYQLPRGTPCP
ncbi:MFS transporter [Streptomyces sp. NBC_00233]|uniref:MFS transporter n=1 Tax=Streptomyces sp. NBC_00233 TaxID=2975686 RepID=UPI002252D13E|nr:MFS transporter [Streptomyces sp. NBC_00233]MCX5233425.1 MFS transporter [Streptomyces sp. NBC_00233]